MLRRRVGRTITAQVAGQPQKAMAASTAGLSARANAGQDPPASKTLEFPFDLRTACSRHCRPSEEAQLRLQAVRERGVKVRSLYRWSTLGIIVAALLFAIVMKQVGGGLWFHLLAAMVLSVCATFVVLWTRFVLTALRPVRGGSAEERSRWEKEIKPIRPSDASAWPDLGDLPVRRSRQYVIRGEQPFSRAGVFGCVAISMLYFATLQPELAGSSASTPSTPV